MTPSRAARLQSMVSDRSESGRLANALLLAPSIQRAFKNGHLQARLASAKNWNSLDEDAGKDDLKAEVSISNPPPHIAIRIYLFEQYIIFQIYPEPYQDILLADRSSFQSHGSLYKISLETEDPKQLPLPSSFLLKTHFKFANALHQFYVEERIADGWGPLQSLCAFTAPLDCMLVLTRLCSILQSKHTDHSPHTLAPRPKIHPNYLLPPSPQKRKIKVRLRYL